MTWRIAPLAAWAFASCAGAPSADDRLRAAAEAVEALESLAYEYAYEGAGSAAGDFGGRVLAVWPEEDGMLYKAELRPAPAWEPAAAEGAADNAAAGWEAPPPALVLSGGGDFVAAHDEARGKFSHGTISGGSGHLVALAPFALPAVFTDAEPFAAELAADFELVSQETVGGVLCDVVRGRTSEYGDATVWWHISVEDDLPRAYRWEAADGSGSLAFEIVDLIASRPISGESLAITVIDNRPGAAEIIIEDARPLDVGTPAPEWTLPGGDGTPISLAELRGEVAVLNFWASWCVPCRDMAAAYEEAASRFADEGVRLLHLNGWEDPARDPGATIEGWLGAPASGSLLLNAERIAPDYKLAVPPAVFVIDRDGTLALIRNPAPAADAAAAALEQTLARLTDGDP